MKKVIFVGHRDLYFGAESVMFRIINFLEVNRISKSLIVLPKSKNSGFREQLNKAQNEDVKLVNYKLIGGGLFRCLLCLVYNSIALVQLNLYFRKNNADVVYTNTSVNILGPLLALLLQKPHIWHFHEQPTGGTFKWIPKGLFPLYRYLITRENCTIIFISNTQRRLWEEELNIKINNSKIIYTPPVELAQSISPVHQENSIVNYGFLGSWTLSKNIISLIDAFVRLKLKYPLYLFELTLMGEGEAGVQIRKTIEEAEIASSINLLPHSSNVAPFYSLIDIFILPSYFGSWGLVVLEALSQKKAVILTSNTGLTELLEQNIDCIFIDPYHKDQLFLAMEKLLLDPQYRNKIAENSFEKLKGLKLNDQFESAIRLLFTIN